MADTRTQIQARYDAKNRKTFTIKLNVNYDMDVIEKLNSVESINGYIRQLIRNDITRTRTGSAPKNTKEDKTMKTYQIKPEYLDMWEGGDSPSDPYRILTEDDIRTLSEEWGKPVEELLEQLIPID